LFEVLSFAKYYKMTFETCNMLKLPILHLIATMRFSFFAVLSGLVALAAVDALPAENLQQSEEIAGSTRPFCCKVISLIIYVDKQASSPS